MALTFKASVQAAVRATASGQVGGGAPKPAPTPTPEIGGEVYHAPTNGFVVSIGSLDDPSKTVSATYRPKELQIDQAVPWAKHNNKSKEGGLQLEFSGADGRVATLELFFDASEGPGESVTKSIEALTELANVREPGSHEDAKKRPHHCVLVFGRVYSGHFKCVIESLSTKYTMFSPDGRALRATVNVKLRETRLANMLQDEQQDKALTDAARKAALLEQQRRDRP